MRKIFIILGIALLIVGTAMVGWGLAYKKTEQQRVVCYKLKYGSQTDEHLKRYNEWLQLPPEERTHLPLGLDKYGQAKTQGQLQQEQQERFKADLDKLTAGEMDAYPFADILYGENWRSELRNYKKREELNELFITVSIVCASVGGVILAGCLLLWVAQLLARGLYALSRLLVGVFRGLKQARAEKLSRAGECSKPLDSALKELTQEVSAIRQYTADHRDDLEKLQDGHDWNMIRPFCLRIIRCIDNLESRISRPIKKNAKVTHLEEIRDELIFALESSGIEQFEPEINSDYRGQEKYAEAVKNKQFCDDPNQTGKIAEVVRPGYQYLIDEENVKVVRPAQVKLFGGSSNRKASCRSKVRK